MKEAPAEWVRWHGRYKMDKELSLRLQRLEDRNAISERVITYAMAIDLGDWELLRECFPEYVHIDFSAAGMPASDMHRDQFVAFAQKGLSGYKARQHLSPNHVIEFDAEDPDRAICRSYMFAQHFQPGAASGNVFLMHGSYTNEMVRSREGWKIARLTQQVSWMDGAPEAS